MSSTQGLTLCAVYRGDDDLFAPRELYGELFPGGRQTLTVITPEHGISILFDTDRVDE